ncbi:unnamed protein product [Cylindrotheca closterium]|uniref:Cytochrome b5 heme-binding domain-containing protein n=1 Tax=Cylindrotheca closterium TaxID=2856 RepID=A0AAD2CNG2_9STRA|nr:unnamed protein product [Cylindrotheca closterium]
MSLNGSLSAFVVRKPTCFAAVGKQTVMKLRQFPTHIFLLHPLPQPQKKITVSTMAPQGNFSPYGSEAPPPPPPPLPISSTFKNSLKQDPIFQEDYQDLQRQPNNYSRLVSFVLGMLTLVAAALGAYFFLQEDDIDLTRGKSQHDNFQGMVSMATIQSHASADDCWMTIHGNVYDMTQYAPIHPGLPTLITRHCGTDATTAYDFEHSIVMLPIVDEYLLGSLQEIEATDFPTMAPTKTPGSPTRAPSPPTLRPTMAPTERGATRSPTSRPTTAPPTQRPTTAPPTELWGCPMEFYTVQDVAQHPDANSCWYALYGVIYDLTGYIDDHKGGRGTILADCGKDATVQFVAEKKHDVSLLIKKGFSSMIIGRLGTTRESGRVACDEVDLVAVTNL